MILWWIRALLIYSVCLLAIISIAALLLHAAGVSSDATAIVCTILGALCGQLAGVVIYSKWSDVKARRRIGQ